MFKTEHMKIRKSKSEFQAQTWVQKLLYSNLQPCGLKSAETRNEQKSLFVVIIRTFRASSGRCWYLIVQVLKNLVPGFKRIISKESFSLCDLGSFLMEQY